MIDCAIHDYVEIACLYHYRVRLILKDATEVQGVASTTRTTNKKEFLVLDSETGQQEIELEKIQSMLALTPNRNFERIDF